MKALELIDRLRHRGVELRVNGPHLRYRPQSAVTANLKAQLVALKPDVLAHLRAEARPPSDPNALWQAALDALEGDPDFPPELIEAARHANAKWQQPDAGPEVQLR